MAPRFPALARLTQGLFGRTNGAQHPATQTPTVSRVVTPLPRLDSYGDFKHHLSNQFWNLNGPTPEQIEWLWMLSDEFGSVITRLVMGTWRRPPEIEPVFDAYCSVCGEGSDGGETGCPMCGAGPEAMQDPDPWERRRLEDFAHDADQRDGLTLQQVGARKTEEGLKHGRSFAIKRFAYHLAPDGAMREAILESVTAGQSARIVRLTDENGRPGGHWVCLRCRTQTSYEPQLKPGPCNQQDCGLRVTYEAWYAEAMSPVVAPGAAATKLTAYYLRSEVSETRWPYQDGSPPVARLWPKVSALLLMDWYAAWALDPKRDKRPDKIAVLSGGDEERFEKWVISDAERRKENPYALSWLYLPAPPGGFEENKVTATVLDLGEKEFKGQMLELREKFEARVRDQYHLSPVQGGDVEGSGGLNNEGLQMRTTAEVIEDLHNHEEVWLQDIAEHLGVTQWTWRFPSALEEDEGRKADVMMKELANAEKAASLGLPARWENGHVVIGEGPIQAPQQPAMGMPGDPNAALPGDVPQLDDVGLNGDGEDGLPGEADGEEVGPLEGIRGEEDDVLKQARVYLKPGESPPEGVTVRMGPKGGRYYDEAPRGSAPAEAPAVPSPGAKPAPGAPGSADAGKYEDGRTTPSVGAKVFTYAGGMFGRW